MAKQNLIYIGVNFGIDTYRLFHFLYLVRNEKLWDRKKVVYISGHCWLYFGQWRERQSFMFGCIESTEVKIKTNQIARISTWLIKFYVYTLLYLWMHLSYRKKVMS